MGNPEGLRNPRKKERKKEGSYQNKKRQPGWKRQARCTTGSCGASLEKEQRQSTHLSSAGKKSSLTKTKSKEDKNKKNRSKTNAHRRQSVRYRSWWKQGYIKQTVSEDHASCLIHKDLTVTTNQIQALLTAARASGGNDECQVRLTGIEQEYWIGTEIGRLGGYSSQGTVTAGDGSIQKGGKWE